MNAYRRRVQYYETDRMGIAHHANYIRWMEEARIDFMDQLGFPYAAMEAQGIVSPVRAVGCKYLRPCTFGDEIWIDVALEGFNGVVLSLRYTMRKQEESICIASSEHVFLDREGRFVRMKQAAPDFCRALEALLAAQADADAAGKSAGETETGR